MKIFSRILSLVIVVTTVFVTGAFGFSDAEARADAATLLARADALVANGSCDRVDFAKELLQGHQKLRRFYPSAGIPDKADALAQIKDILRRYCASTSPSSSNWVIPIITSGGGGVTCSACTPMDPTGSLALRAPTTISTPSCQDCGNVNALLIALIYIKPEDREKFIAKLTPGLRTALREELNRPTSPVINVQKSIEVELNRPASIAPQTLPQNSPLTGPATIPRTVDGKIKQPQLKPGNQIKDQ